MTDEMELAGTVLIQESALSFRDLLAQVRNERQDLDCYFILDRISAYKGAVQCVETRQYMGFNGFEFLYPSAACTRKMYVKASIASSVAVNLEQANISWEEMYVERDNIFEF